ncbi:bifunctional phosphopantothenoylcysteine decarboxylase/phosphopantothenate--cysteine ligase CoaBC [Rhizosphaericola mali]|uniref:Coenzyme A biosynthesis bifunctional protein CoaBC n=1 Tax=Rhizosphaericola mali TaxID=2545455 RepID=A0A5P2G3N4_9BACT|nr:bifunctional phosphopantothenoylcysteine decarboxylase/phosphopantothenate--cysteine ligase CoaBC [Rhizosphaericola mali]QES89348.1 bifunctional phosphopantothenoylcysteine decarboxylase/phosphopantothenate--cysteine ligase CoaBC [Rhizosphaericola mali]
MIQGKKILIAITGSIAAYKIITLVRLLVKNDCDVKILMTKAATDFVSPLVLETLSKNKVLVDLFETATWNNHVMLGRWADLFIIAPATCNTIAKLANGITDNFVQAVYFSATCPVWLCPAMDEDMWHHNATKRNLHLLKEDGVRILEVGKGELASGLFGDGRLIEPEELLIEIQSFFREKTLAGKKVLITAGPTYEAIDPVRFIGNHSSGKMGFAIAEAFYFLGADVTLITGPTHLKTPYKEIKRIDIISANEMYEQCQAHFSDMDFAVLSAAVADYYLEDVAQFKIKKKDIPSNNLTLELKETVDILASLGSIKRENQILVGFALETNNELANAQLKLISKNADLIVLNSTQVKGAGFGSDNNKITILSKEGIIENSDLLSKKEIATIIVSTISNYKK